MDDAVVHAPPEGAADVAVRGETSGLKHGPDGRLDLLGLVTADHERLLAEAASLGRPLSVYPLPVRPAFRWLARPRRWVEGRGRAKPAGPRGTPRPQLGLEYLCARLIDRGLVRPTRDLERLHADLVRRGMALRFGDREQDRPRQQRRDVEVVVDRIRALLGVT